MKKQLLAHKTSWLVGTCAALALVSACNTTMPASSGAASAGSAGSAGTIGPGAAQKVLPNGLHLVSQTSTRLLYVRPGVNFSKYTKVQILPCFVSMKPRWQEDYNQTVSTLGDMVTDADVQTIKNVLAAQFKQVFTTELTQAGYPVVDTSAPDVLLLRPALLDVQVTQPDTASSSFTDATVSSAGSAKLYLELWDPVSKTILARVIDAQADVSNIGVQGSNFVTNREAADAILKKWADNLVKHLEAAKAAGGTA
jgi:uncharacterized protein DUF3313